MKLHAPATTAALLLWAPSFFFLRSENPLVRWRLLRLRLRWRNHLRRSGDLLLRLRGRPSGVGEQIGGGVSAVSRSASGEVGGRRRLGLLGAAAAIHSGGQHCWCPAEGRLVAVSDGAKTEKDSEHNINHGADTDTDSTATVAAATAAAATAARAAGGGPHGHGGREEVGGVCVLLLRQHC